MPGFIQFDADSLIVLTSTLLAPKPEEGCALLIGDNNIMASNYKTKGYQIKVIWPCCNIWEPGLLSPCRHQNSEVRAPQKTCSRENRFAIDPREQLLAQKWARTKNLKILGSAHSHPDGEAVPSPTDRALIFTSGLMVIVSGIGSAQAWWMQKDQNQHPQELIILNCH